MQRPESAGQAIAREMAWNYRPVEDDEGARKYFADLYHTVEDAIAERLAVDGRVWVGRELRVRVGVYTIHARLTNIEPLLATQMGRDTIIHAEYQEPAKDERQDISAFVSEVIRYPDDRFQQIFDSLVGLTPIINDMHSKLYMLLNPASLSDWLRNAYRNQAPSALLGALRDRYPLIILEGEVGAGKTALARSIGDRLSRELQRQIALYVINSQVRGGGHVGELTQNIARAFAEAERTQEREQIPVLMLLDEADALAQSRGGRQTHHEDDAGVNALIQCIDRLRGRPMAVLFATNLVQSLDSAIVRRAVATYRFERPTPAQRAEVFRRMLSDVGITEAQINELVASTEPRPLASLGTYPHRYTYSDLTQRVIPTAVEMAITEQKPLTIEMLRQACRATQPTPELPSTRERLMRGEGASGMANSERVASH